MGSILSESIAQLGSTLLLVVQIIFLIVCPYVFYVAFKEALKAAATGVIDEDTDFTICDFVVLFILYAADIISLGTKIYEGVIK